MPASRAVAKSAAQRWPTTADAVVVGGGTVGGVVRLLPAAERGRAGRAPRAARRWARGRAAGPPASCGARAARRRRCAWPSGAAPSTGRQAEDLGIDSGFVRQGYFMPVLHRVRRRRRPTAGWRCSRARGLAVRWIDSDEADALNPTMAPGSTRGAPSSTRTATSTRPGTSWPTRWPWPQARASRSASGWPSGPAGRGPGGSPGWRPMRDRSPPRRWSSPAVRELADGRPAGRAPDPGRRVRHQVAVTEPHPDFDPTRLPMVFDLRRRALLAARGGRACSSA